MQAMEPVVRILFRWEDLDILMVEQRLQQTKI